MRQYHWWIVAKDEAGKTILIYGAPMEDAARERADQWWWYDIMVTNGGGMTSW